MGLPGRIGKGKRWDKDGSEKKWATGNQQPATSNRQPAHFTFLQDATPERLRHSGS